MLIVRERILEGMLHPEMEVRRFCFDYFGDSYDPDPLVTTMAMKATDQYGLDNRFLNFDFQDLTHTDESLRWMLSKSAEYPKHDSFPFNVQRTLLHLPVPLLVASEAEIVATFGAEHKVIAAVRERIALSQLTSEELWDALREHCRIEFDSDKEQRSPDAYPKANALILAMVPHREALKERVRDLCKLENYSETEWLCLFAAQAAGELKLLETVPDLVEGLRTLDDDSYGGIVETALVKMRSDTVLKQYPDTWYEESFTFRFSYATMLEKIKTPKSAERAIECATIDARNQNDAVSPFYEAALRNFETDAIEPAREELNRANVGMFTNDLMGTLWPLCQFVGIELPERDEWKKAADKARQQMLTLIENRPRGNPEPSKHFKPSPKAPISQPIIKVDDAIARNDPCRCGSGKKFKKCCINKK